MKLMMSGADRLEHQILYRKSDKVNESGAVRLAYQKPYRTSGKVYILKKGIYPES